MIDYVDECKGCETCYHCGADRTQVTRCDECGEVCDKVYRLDNKDYCDSCIESVCDEWFEDLTLGGKLDLFCFDADEFGYREGAEVAVSSAWYDLSLDNKIDYYNEDDGEIKEV